MKKTYIMVILLLACIFISGCDEKHEIVINGQTINTATMEHKHCTRNATATNADVKLNYDIYYTDDVLNIVKSEEKIISSSDDVLNTYEEAYKKIHANYKDLDYYDTEVIRGDTTVTSTITINYDKVDIDRLIEIEGEEDNIFEQKIPKVSKWLSFAKKFGTTCEKVEE